MDPPCVARENVRLERTVLQMLASNLSIYTLQSD
jgi:hypothetical protein